MLKGNDEQVLQEVESPRFVPGSPDGPADNGLTYIPPWKEKLEAEAPSRQRPASEVQSPELPGETEGEPTPRGARSGESRKGFRRRHPIAVVVGSVLFALAVGGGYVYWSYASPFDSTDDAFTAPRQIAIAPKVTGYVTQVPVTDNEHVAAGGGIARLYDRAYRIALEQASAQGAAAAGTLQNIYAQIDRQPGHINARPAQRE